MQRTLLPLTSPGQIAPLLRARLQHERLAKTKAAESLLRLWPDNERRGAHPLRSALISLCVWLDAAWPFVMLIYMAGRHGIVTASYGRVVAAAQRRLDALTSYGAHGVSSANVAAEFPVGVCFCSGALLAFLLMLLFS